jgi:predicted outer membrane repeat protein
MKLLVSLACSIFIITTSVSAGVRINGIGFEYATIQAAVNAAVNNDRLHVSTGLYTENVVVTNKMLTIEGGYFLDYITTTNIPSLTVIDGSSIANSTIRLVSNATVVLETLRVTGGSGFVLGGGVNIGTMCSLYTADTEIEQNSGFFGGGVGVSDNASFTVYSNTYINNNIAPLGGAVSAVGSNAVVTLGPFTDCAGNVAILGGGVAMVGGSYTQHRYTRIFGNLASTAGGGIYMANGASGTVLGPGTFIGGPIFFVNQVTNGNGGGIYMINSSLDISGPGTFIGGAIAFGNGAGIFMTNSILTIRDQARIGFSGVIIGTYDSGGGIYAEGSTVILSNNAGVGYCNANTNGGGIYAENSSVYLYDSQVGNTNNITANHAEVGGGLFAQSSSIMLDNSRITENSAETCGGLLIEGGSLRLTDSTIANNTATNIGGILGQGVTDAVFDHTMIVSNSAQSQVGGVYWYVSPLTITNNSMISYNSAQIFGGMYSTFSTMTVYKSEVSYNETLSHYAGILHYLAPLTLVDTHVHNNQADLAGATNGIGGGITAIYADLTMKALNRHCILTSNSASSGGGLFMLTGNLDIEAAQPWVYAIEGNTAVEQGGGIYAEGAVTAVISGRVVFEDNTALDGGGIYARDYCSFSLLPAGGYAPFFTGNHADRDGGGIGILHNSGITAVNNKFINNSAQSLGGAMYASTGVTVMIDSDFGAAPPSDLPQSQFINNHITGTGSGGALFMSADSIAEITSSLFISNSAHLRAGAIGAASITGRLVNIVAAHNTATTFNEGLTFAASVIEIDSCTIAYNGDIGINTPSIITELENCIVWGHTSAQVTGVVTAQFCDIQYGFPGNFNITNDPLFANPSMFDFQLSFGSPCIDAGATQPGVTNDCIGKARPYGGGWDIGAYEYIPEPGGILLLLVLVMGHALHRKR